MVGLVLSANEPYSIFSPCLTSMVNRETIGIITGIDKPDANVERVRRWLELAGCKKVFPVSSITGEGVKELVAFLNDEKGVKKKTKIVKKGTQKPKTLQTTQNLDTWLL